MRTSNWKTERFQQKAGKCQTLKGSLFTPHGTVEDVIVTRKTMKVRGLGLRVEQVGVDCFLPVGMEFGRQSYRKVELPELVHAYGGVK